MFALLLAASHCADPGFCPTRREFARAAREYDDRMEWALNEAANADSQELVLVTVHSPRRISGLRCDKPGSSKPRSVMCKAIFRYADSSRVRTLSLVRDAKGWSVAASREADSRP